MAQERIADRRRWSTTCGSACERRAGPGPDRRCTGWRLALLVVAGALIGGVRRVAFLASTTSPVACRAACSVAGDRRERSRALVVPRGMHDASGLRPIVAARRSSSPRARRVHDRYGRSPSGTDASRRRHRRIGAIPSVAPGGAATAAAAMKRALRRRRSETTGPPTPTAHAAGDRAGREPRSSRCAGSTTCTPSRCEEHHGRRRWTGSLAEAFQDTTPRSRTTADGRRVANDRRDPARRRPACGATSTFQTGEVVGFYDPESEAARVRRLRGRGNSRSTNG